MPQSEVFSRKSSASRSCASYYSVRERTRLFPSLANLAYGTTTCMHMHVNRRASTCTIQSCLTTSTVSIYSGSSNMAAFCQGTPTLAMLLRSSGTILGPYLLMNLSGCHRRLAALTAACFVVRVGKRRQTKSQTVQPLICGKSYPDGKKRSYVVAAQKNVLRL